MAGVTLIPPESGTFEHAVSSVGAKRYPIDTEIIANLSNPWKCHPAYLPALAARRSVNLYVETWPEITKRQEIDAAPERHVYHGTPWAIGEYLRAIGAEVVEIVSHPVEFYWFDEDEAAQRAWLEGLPEVRIFFTAQTGGDEAFYWGDGCFWTEDGDPPPDVYCLADDVLLRSGRRVVLIEDGVETEIKWLDGAERLMAPEAADKLGLPIRLPEQPFCWGEDYLDDAPLMRDRAIEFTLWFRRSKDFQMLAHSGALEPVELTPQWASLPRSGPHDFMCFGDGHYDDYWSADDAALYAYERIRLYRPGERKDGERLPSAGYWGASSMRWGLDPYTMIVKAALPVQLADDQLFLDETFWGDYLHDTDTSPTGRLVDACNAGKRTRDTILLDTALFRPMTFDDRPTWPAEFGIWTRT